MDRALLFLQLVKEDRSLIEGESETAGFRKYVIISDWSWSLAGSDRGAVNRLEPSVFVFSKPTDRSTTALLNLLKSGELLHSAVVHLRDSSQDSRWYLKITLSDVRVSSYDLDLTAEDKGGSADEKWTLSYSKIAFDYTPHSGKSRAEGALTGQFVRSAKASQDKPLNSLIQDILSLAEEVEGDGLSMLKRRFDDLIARRMKSKAPSGELP